jgi:hypothetical protein
VAGEGITWVRPFGDDAAVELFDGHPVGREVRPLIVGTEWPDRRPLMLQCHSHSPRRRILWHTLEFEQ